MALTLPLQIFETIYKCCAGEESSSKHCNYRLAERLLEHATLMDLIKWRRVSKAFRRAADNRIKAFTRIDVRVYPGLNEIHNHQRETDCYSWHPRAPIMMIESAPNQVGIAIDSNMKTVNVRALLEVLSVFRNSAQQLFMDSPVIDLFVSQINKEQLYSLIELLRKNRTLKRTSAFFDSNVKILDMPPQKSLMPYGPFFPNLKKFTVTSTSNQLEHLSRLCTYAVGVELLYHRENIDILCLRIILGGRWFRKPHVRMFKHVARFRQWTEANSLGERYFQQFTPNTKSNRSIV
uniref:F-box domain-containing protein n=2 Tax=Bursaphelenchus xylophilus TaxID=6326 RepID=A0A1I7STZ2_BURXY